MLSKAIQSGIQAAARIEQAAQPAIAGAALAGLAAAGQQEQQPRRDRTASEAFLEEGLVGVISDRIVSKGRSRAQVQNQEQPARRDARGRFQPVARPLNQPEEERKTPQQSPERQQSPARAEEDQPLLQEEQPVADIQIQQQTPTPIEDQRPINQQDVERIVQERANDQQRRDPSYLKMAGAFLIGQIMNTDNVIKIMDALHKWWVQSKETETLNDPWYEGKRVEEILQRPVPEGCKRIVYRDAQTDELKTIVVCGAQGERLYPGK